MPPDKLGVPSPEETEEAERRRSEWEAMSDEERQVYNARIDQETEARNAQREAERQRKNTEHREKYIGKKATATVDIRVQHGVEVTTIANQGETVDIIDTDTLSHGWENNVKIRTENGTEDWVNSMCLHLQE